jgi:transcriptional regulator with PAS, ATPase and Fis domain
LVAKSIHHLSDRRDAPFIEINCASIPVTLLESELFGHERGAFTDASRSKPGLFESANKGTLFLDEIGEMEPAMQAKLLRVLESRRLRRVGGTRDIEIDVRVIAATNRNLRDAIREGAFREDLYYRLNVVPIHIPPLRERHEDIPVLARFYLEKYSRTFSRTFTGIDPEALLLLEAYPWPGNIRELKNVIEKICIMHNGTLLITAYLPQELTANLKESSDEGIPSISAEMGLEEAVEAFESRLISRALVQSAGNVQQAAVLLRIPRGTLRYKMEKYRL